MRCNNCGYDNAPGATTCVKCGNHLGSRAAVENRPIEANAGLGKTPERQPRPTVVGIPPTLNERSEYTPRPTVIGIPGEMGNNEKRQPRPTEVFPSGTMDVDTTPQTSNLPLGSAAWPGQEPQTSNLKPQTSNPQSDAPTTKTLKPFISPSDTYVKCDNCNTNIPAEFKYCPICGTPIIRKPTEPQCSLTIIPDEDETVEDGVNNYEGSSIILKRDNTENSNRTITSKEQAILNCEDGKWYIENRSELCSTYLEANRRLELFDGDIIMLGDRRFKFNITK